MSSVLDITQAVGGFLVYFVIFMSMMSMLVLVISSRIDRPWAARLSLRVRRFAGRMTLYGFNEPLVQDCRIISLDTEVVVDENGYARSVCLTMVDEYGTGKALFVEATEFQRLLDLISQSRDIGKQFSGSLPPGVRYTTVAADTLAVQEET